MIYKLRHCFGKKNQDENKNYSFRAMFADIARKDKHLRLDPVLIGNHSDYRFKNYK